MRIYERVVFGATFSGCAVAVANPENTLVIEQSGLIGTDFVDSLNERPVGELTIKTTAGNEFFEELTKRGLINDKDIYLGPTVFVLSSFLKRLNCNIWFWTKVISINKTDGLFDIEVYGKEGIVHIFARNIVDTTATGILHKNSNINKALNALITLSSDSNLQVKVNSINGFITYSQPLDIDDDWVTAREKLITTLIDNNAKIAHIANSFAYSTNETNVITNIDENWAYIPSISFSNLVTAFEGGLMI